MFLLVLTGTVPSVGLEAPSLVSAERPGQDVSVEMKDGVLTATFSDEVDDAALRAILPALAARDVQSISLRGAPVRDIEPLAGMTGLKALEIGRAHV